MRFAKVRGAALVEVGEVAELGLVGERGRGRRDDLVGGLRQVERLRLWLLHVPRRVDEHLDAVVLRIREVDRPRVAVSERHDVAHLGVLLEDGEQPSEIVERPGRAVGGVVDAVRLVGVGTTGDERDLVVVVRDLRQEHDLVLAERAAVGDLEAEHVAIERDHLVDVVDVDDGVRHFETESVCGLHRQPPGIGLSSTAWRLPS